MCRDALAFKLKSPAILVIGEVAAQAVIQMQDMTA
jgi:uroporphyrin-III C-methyltransferase